MSGEEAPSVQIGLREIYDLALETRDGVRDLTQRVGSVSADVGDHETRLKRLEHGQAAISGAAGVLGAIGGALLGHLWH